MGGASRMVRLALKKAKFVMLFLYDFIRYFSFMSWFFVILAILATIARDITAMVILWAIVAVIAGMIMYGLSSALMKMPWFFHLIDVADKYGVKVDTAIRVYMKLLEDERVSEKDLNNLVPELKALEKTGNQELQDFALRVRVGTVAKITYYGFLSLGLWWLVDTPEALANTVKEMFKRANEQKQST
jgi:uncharacterized protein YhhL (DUF1145 family)